MTITQPTRMQQFITFMQRANQVAASTELDPLLEQMLALLLQVLQAPAGVLYLYEPAGDEQVLTVIRGDTTIRHLLGKHFAVDRCLAGYVVRERKPVFISDVTREPLWNQSIGALSGMGFRTVYCLPLLLQDQPLGAVEIFDLPLTVVDDPDDVTLAQLLCERLAVEIEKTRMLVNARRRERRLQALVDIVSHITTTLDRDQLLERIMHHASQLLNVEATSIWLRDERTGDLVLQMATGKESRQLRDEEVRVPAGRGIIGYVTSKGERVLVNDVRNDSRFYRKIDQQSGFVTRSILCLPLRAPTIHLGSGAGVLPAKIIGGAQALNKRDGQSFSAEDISLFETLASQAATVLQLAWLYERNSRLFLGIIKAVTGAIDLKDPYTRGHSQRVADFAVAIAREMELSQEMLYHVQIGAMLHDVGKIGVGDAILKKPEHLTNDEMSVMKLHPTYGVRLLHDADLEELLRAESPALAQHHERLDGSGYPLGLKGDEISLIGRIVAVADAFDAMTSSRPYRPAMSIEQSFSILSSAVGTEYDTRCVEALIRARAQGMIKTQAEREG